ncbi:MAG: hypothetical protein GY765_06240 [bacterium]|nr:hypothetical protein [bacterium]
MFLLACSAPVHAIDAPADGDFGYTIYDIAVNNILNGPIGVVGGIACIVIAAIFCVKNQIMLAVPAFVGAGVLLGADDMVTTFGLII